MLRRIRPSVILGRQFLARRQPCSRVSLDPMVSQIHLENQVSSQRFGPTTGEVKTVIPTAENMSAVFGKDGVETEIQMGQMRQTLGKPGFDLLFNKH
jgi:hypothetical protein